MIASAESSNTRRLPPHDDSPVWLLTWGAPVFWVCFPLAAVVFLTVNADDTEPLLWVIAVGWLVVALGVLAYRVRFHPRRHRESLRRQLDTGALCEVHGSPLRISDGEAGCPTHVLIDVRTPDERAARIVTAFGVWGERAEAGDAWGHEPNWIVYTALTSEELFGGDARGGYLVRDCGAEPGDWTLLSARENAEYPDAPFRDGDVIRIAGPRRASGTGRTDELRDVVVHRPRCRTRREPRSW